VLARGLQAQVGGALLLALGACGSRSDGGASSGASAEATAHACVDPAALSAGERNTREALNYTDLSQDPQKVCGACAFFHPNASGDGAAGCGKCDMFSGGQVSARGHCDSWSAKS
jgi:hypothetical protein